MEKNRGIIAILYLLITFSLFVKLDTKTLAAGLKKEIPIDEQDILATSNDFEEVYELDQEILKELQSFCLSRQLPEYPKEINYQRIVKVYMGADIIQMDNGREEMLEALESNEYGWLVSINTAAGNYQLTIARRLPLKNDEIEQQEIHDTERKWMIKSHSLTAVEPYLDQLEKKSEELAACTRLVLVEGQSGFFEPVAIGFDDEKAKYLIGLGFQYGAVSENTCNVSVYEYDEIAERVKKMYVTDSTETQWGPLHFSGSKLLPAVKKEQAEQPDENEEQKVQTLQWWKIVIPVLMVVGLTGMVVLLKKKTH